VRLQGFTLPSGYAADPPGRDLAFLVALVARGRLDPQVTDVAPWEEIGAALARLRSRQVIGKCVLVVRP
jgi:NADPH:quinone reductase-like Zn-dependent oxidoreductase